MPWTDKHITRGLGKLTPAVWRALMRCIDFVEQYGTELITLLKTEKAAQSQRPFIFARITGYACLSGSTTRFKYAWTQVRLTNGSDVFADETNGLSGTIGENYALNTVEDSNASAVVAPGVDISSDDYPPGFCLRPIQGASGSGPVVPMFLIRDNKGTLRYAFALANAHDGACESADSDCSDVCS